MAIALEHPDGKNFVNEVFGVVHRFNIASAESMGRARLVAAGLEARPAKPNDTICYALR
jgi:hypothetical protein